MKVALVTNIAPPYRVPTWNALARSGVDLRVFLCAQSHPDRLWQTDLSDHAFDHEVLDGASLYVRKLETGLRLRWSIRRRLEAFAPERIVLTGYLPPTLLLAALYGRQHDVPVIDWWGTHDMSSRFSATPFELVRRLPLRLMDGFVTYGSLATEYLRGRGVQEDRIVTGTNTVDVEEVARLVDRVRSDAPRRRDPRVVRFLFVGQLIESKGVWTLLAAFGRVPDPSRRLDIVGYGPLADALVRTLEAEGDERIQYHGGTDSLGETCRHYASADCLIMPSLREVWGLVVNEALAAGLYVVASNRAGATPDLVGAAPVDVGLAVTPGDPGALAAAIEQSAGIIRSGSVNRRAIRAWGCRFTPRRYAGAILRALDRVA